MTGTPPSYEDIRDAVANHERVLARGAGTKPCLSRAGEDCTPLDMTTLTGVVDYDPNEFVLTARAGTTLNEIASLLEQQQQYMPFDPPFAQAGATIGGTVAAGLSGPGFLRYGGLRDFLLGIRFVDGTATLLQAGGRVVKNAAGFDFPKLLIGSLGRLGVLVEITFKVFPRPAATATWRVTCKRLDEAVETMCNIASGAWEVSAMDLEPPASLFLRMGGHPEALPARFERMGSALGLQGELLTGDEDQACWQALRDCSWADDRPVLVKVPITPTGLTALDDALNGLGAARRYSVAGNVAWVALETGEQVPGLEKALLSLNLAGLVLRGDVATCRCGVNHAEQTERLVKATLDPRSRFPS